MLGRGQAMTAPDALSLILGHIRPAGLREVRLEAGRSLGMVCSRDLTAPDDLPSFSRSTVDGYAVKAADTFGATEAMPAYLHCGQEILMGGVPEKEPLKGEASKIPTGGMLPCGADAVVMFEYVQDLGGGMIEVLRPVAPGENVIRAGEDVRKGEVFLMKGRRIRPQDIGACAANGMTELFAYARPVVSIISTGDEIVPADTVPGPGQVRDVNSFIIAGMLEESGCMPKKKGIYADTYDGIRSVLEGSLQDSDMVILSGGTSVGIKDMIARILQDIGQPGVLFHGLSLKPGKPMIGGVVRGIPVFGLPGHPAAVAVCFNVLVRPVLEFLSGADDRLSRMCRPVVRARLDRNLSSSAGREEHVRVMIEMRDDGLWAVPVLGKSGLITTLVKADGICVVPLHVNGIEKGEWVEVQLF